MNKPFLKPVSAQVNFPALEEEVLEYWKKNKIFEKSLESRPADKTWTFLDGPPFITGLPHYGTLLSSIPKDLFPRYWTMKGYRVRRVWGWDCHGLPAENKVEEKLTVKRKKEIEEKIGVKKFIDECKLYVKNVSSEWEWYVDHVGRWVDFKNAYKTMDLPYMETVMWVFKQMYEKGYIYKGLRVSLYCPHCSTPISNFEVAMDPDNYKSVTEPTAVFKYQLAAEKNTYLLAWSTTPWNKLATPALAVNPELAYVKVKQGAEYYILARDTIKMLNPKPKPQVVATFRGKDLVGQHFVPHYDFYKVEPGKRAFVVVPGDFVTAEEGTGVVTIAAYGEEDLAVMLKENIQIVLHIDDEGILKPEVPQWAGRYYLDVDPLVIADLKQRGLIYRVDSYAHTVPTCWRCHTRLIYAPQDAWYVNIQKLKARLFKNNEVVNWFPAHFKYGRFLKSMEAAPDWCISRSRYWGSPVPVWECKNGHRFVPGSIAELEKVSGTAILDLHKPEIDEVVIPCQQCKEKARRVPEVLDSWIEAGSASFAERHWPFGQPAGGLTSFFPPDFIVEYTGQIRAWFYVLHVIATALYDSHAFKNVVVSGVILGTDGRKMSKNFGNYPDPAEMLKKYGGDALRLYLLGSPVMHGEDIRISEEQYRAGVAILLLFWNIYAFFVNYAIVDKWTPTGKPPQSKNVLDRWILSRMTGSIFNLTQKGYETFDTPEIVNQAVVFLNDLSLWYIRRTRDRVGPTSADGQDKHEAYETLWWVLTQYAKALSPLIPFTTEAIFRNLAGEESVHLTSWPEVDPGKLDAELEEAMAYGRELASRIHAFRKEHNVKVRLPLKKLTYHGPKQLNPQVEKLVKDEVNVYELAYGGSTATIAVSGDTSDDNKDLPMGATRELIRLIQKLRKEKGCKIDERVSVVLPETYKGLPERLLALVKRETLSSSIIWGKTLSIESPAKESLMPAS